MRGLRKIKHRVQQNTRSLRNQIGLVRQVEKMTAWQYEHTAVMKQQVLPEKVLEEVYSERPQERNHPVEWN